ncbi:MAG: hypothetical protein ACOC4M_16940 [Promethearchaeia archaeon]
MGKANQYLGFIGGAMMLLGGLLYYLSIQDTLSYLSNYGITVEDLRSLGIEPNLMYIPMLTTLLCGIFALIGSVMIVKGIKEGNIVLLITGIVAVVGMFIPVGEWRVEGVQPLTFHLSGSLIFVDPFLVLLGGIIGVAAWSQSDAQDSSGSTYESYAEQKYQAPAKPAFQEKYQAEGTQRSKKVRFCQACGASLKSGNRYCPECGEPIE